MAALGHTYGVGLCRTYEGVSPICPFPKHLLLVHDDGVHAIVVKDKAVGPAKPQLRATGVARNNGIAPHGNNGATPLSRPTSAGAA